MTNDEQQFMGRLRAALGRTGVSKKIPPLPGRPEGELKALLKRADRSREERLELLETLKKAAGPLNLNVHEVPTVDDAGHVVTNIALATATEWGGDKRVAMHDTEFMASLGLAVLLGENGIGLSSIAYEDGETVLCGKQRLRREVEASYMGVTGADWCAVDCAAIALLSGHGKGRAVSLVPSVHVAVMMLDGLVADLPELYAQLDAMETLPASFNFISGPSKTADVEAQLVHGAHGPREMHLVVITE